MSEATEDSVGAIHHWLKDGEPPNWKKVGTAVVMASAVAVAVQGPSILEAAIALAILIPANEVIRRV